MAKDCWPMLWMIARRQSGDGGVLGMISGIVSKTIDATRSETVACVPKRPCAAPTCGWDVRRFLIRSPKHGKNKDKRNNPYNSSYNGSQSISLLLTVASLCGPRA